MKSIEIKRSSLKCFRRDRKQDCYLGKPIRFGLKDYMVVITTDYEVGLIDSKKNIEIISWLIWKKRKKIAKNPNFFIWDNEIRRIVKYHSKQITKKLRKMKVIKRTPAIRRTPTVKRTPVKQ